MKRYRYESHSRTKWRRAMGYDEPNRRKWAGRQRRALEQLLRAAFYADERGKAS